MTSPHDRVASPLARAVARGVIMLALFCPPAMAQAADADAAPYTVRVRHLDVTPGSPAAAQRTLARLGDAALEACGGSQFSLREVKLAIRASACWRTAMAGALAQIGDPLLAQTYENEERRNG